MLGRTQPGRGSGRARKMRHYADAVPAHPFVAEWIAGAEDEARAIGWEAWAAWP
jgi:hypothetical protein